MKNAVFCDGTPCGSLLVTANTVPSSPILITPMMEVLSSFWTSALTRATRRNIQVDGILHCHRRGNLKSYKVKRNGQLSLPTALFKRLSSCEFKLAKDCELHGANVLGGSIDVNNGLNSTG
jgi:hypothetical protein